MNPNDANSDTERTRRPVHHGNGRTGRGNGHTHKVASNLNGKAKVRRGSRPAKPVLITGGAGFIGTNLAHRLAGAGRPVIIYDNLSRPGVSNNLEWLKREHGALVRAVVADVRQYGRLRACVAEAGQVFHLAAQVAVTTSLKDPTLDFDVNVRGALNVLEAIRQSPEPPPLVFTSTNKVYGALDDLALRRNGTRYEPAAGTVRRRGVSERRTLDFHSPYGCSKGAADQYILDYTRSYGLSTVVFRMSCIYGLHQMGTEDQGWVAHFLKCALAGAPITIYGDGLQVRDVLFADDLVDAFLLAQKNIHRLRGQAFNIGGGSANTISLTELMGLIEQLHQQPLKTHPAEWRVADQRYFVSDIGKFQTATGWTPKTSVAEGVGRLYEWLRSTPMPIAAVHNSNGNGRARRNGRAGRRSRTIDAARRTLART